jgi:hypothetical protein
MVLDLGVDQENNCGDNARRQRMGRGEQHRRYPRERTANLRQEVDKRYPEAP